MEAGPNVQRQLSDFLQYELYHILGAYSVAARCHQALAEELTPATQSSLPSPLANETGPPANPPTNELGDMASMSSQYNWHLSHHRHGRPERRPKVHPEISPAGIQATWPYREPAPEDLPLSTETRFEREARRGVQEDRTNPWKGSEICERIPQFYTAAIHALGAWKPRIAGDSREAHLLADSIITQLDHVDLTKGKEEILVARRNERYCQRRRCAHDILFGHISSEEKDAAPAPSEAELDELYTSDDAFRVELYEHDLSTGNDSLPLFIVRVLTEAHLSMHAVEAWQKTCLGERAQTYSKDVVDWLDLELERCIELNTFAYCMSKTAPWLFACDEHESAQVRSCPRRAWEDTRPARGMWIAGALGLLALHRRAYARGLRGDGRGSYNDYHKLQRLIRATDRRLRVAPIRVSGASEFLIGLDAQAHHHIGELYRAKHAHRPARKHFNIAHNRLGELRGIATPSPSAPRLRPSTRDQVDMEEVLLHSRRAVELLISYGKASYELGRYKEALCWHLRGWRDFLKLLAADTDTVTNTEDVDTAIDSLELVRYEPEMLKADLIKYLKPVVEQLDRVTVSKRYGALAGEILLRLGHLLLVLNLAPSAAEDGTATHLLAGERLALRCLMRARECDLYSTMIVADLLKASFRLAKTGTPNDEVIQGLLGEKYRSVDELWPHGGEDFERLARAAEYLTLLRQLVSQPPEPLATENGDDPKKRRDREALAARSLLFDFFMNTDSINVRKSQGYDLLMKRASPSELPSGSKLAIEFVCMRRYSSFFPLLPRPMAFRALCGGYFVRLHNGADADSTEISPEAIEDEPTAADEAEVTNANRFGIVIDPGMDFVETLYRAGYSLGDIDMIIVTHDHVDHAGALDALISLLHARSRTFSHEGAGSKRTVTVLLSESMYKRYENTGIMEETLPTQDAHGHKRFTFECIEKLTRVKKPHAKNRAYSLEEIAGFPDAFELVVISTHSVDGKGHKDLTGNPAFGLCIKAKSRSGGVAFTSDTPAPREVGTRGYDKWLETWAPALEADVLIAHLSSVPLSELRKLAHRAPLDEMQALSLRDKLEGCETRLTSISTQLQESGTVKKGVIEYGLWLRSKENSVTAPIVGEVPTKWLAPAGHAFLSGILRWAEAYDRTAKRSLGGGGLFVVGELSEELGTMRSKVATSISDTVFARQSRREARVSFALSGDIGLNVLVRCGDDARARSEVLVLCATCSLDTDRIPGERYHSPDDMCETCVKGENEGIFYNCREHAPSTGDHPVFLEQLERFDIFGR